MAQRFTSLIIQTFIFNFGMWVSLISFGQTAPLSTNCNLAQNLPIPTHWNKAANKIQPGASDQIVLANSKPFSESEAINYLYNYNFLPSVNNYIGEQFSVNSISNVEALNWVQKICIKNNQSFQFWKPSTFNGMDGIKEILYKVPKKSGISIIISGLTNSQSMFTLFLPANWTPNNEGGSYPIIFNGFYDVNDNLFHLEGETVAQLIAQSTKANGTGAIGLLWNGAGALASRTTNPQAWTEFEQIINLVEILGGDRHRIIGFGESRGGITPLQMASNPNLHNYTFTYIDAAVPPADLGLISQVASSTFPYLMSAVEWSSGLLGSYKNSFIYPSLGNDLAGLNSMQTHLKILTGLSDATEIDANYSLGSPHLIQALKANGTPIYLEVGSHDIIVPSFDQFFLYRKYLEANIPVELQVNYLAGHFSDKGKRQIRLENQMKRYTHSGISTQDNQRPSVNDKSISFFKVNQNTGLLESQKPEVLFTLELPRYLTPEVDGYIIATGIPGTQYEITFQTPEGKISTLKQTLNLYGYQLTQLESALYPSGM